MVLHQSSLSLTVFCDSYNQNAEAMVQSPSIHPFNLDPSPNIHLPLKNPLLVLYMYI